MNEFPPKSGESETTDNSPDWDALTKVEFSGDAPEDISFDYDERTRETGVSRLSVEPGEDLESVAGKLISLKNKNRPAFAVFNGVEINNSNFTSPSEIVDYYKSVMNSLREAKSSNNFTPESASATPELSASAVESLKSLDERDTRESLGLLPTDLGNIMGVMIDVKSCGEASINQIDELSQKSFEDHLTDLGLTFDKELQTYDGLGSTMNYIFGKKPEDVKKTRELVEASKAEGQTGDKTRELGKMFGFPESATEYFIARGERFKRGEKLEKPNGRFYIHDPENLDAELAAYETPILDSLKKYCPASAADLETMNQER